MLLSNKFFGWENREQMADDFCEGVEKLPPDDDIIVAAYNGDPYDGEAFVLFVENGELFEVHGSHCSCYGLENQWTPEKTTVEALSMRTNKPHAMLEADMEWEHVLALAAFRYIGMQKYP